MDTSLGHEPHSTFKVYGQKRAPTDPLAPGYSFGRPRATSPSRRRATPPMPPSASRSTRSDISFSPLDAKLFRSPGGSSAGGSSARSQSAARSRSRGGAAGSARGDSSFASTSASAYGEREARAALRRKEHEMTVLKSTLQKQVSDEQRLRARAEASQADTNAHLQEVLAQQRELHEINKRLSMELEDARHAATTLRVELRKCRSECSGYRDAASTPARRRASPITSPTADVKASQWAAERAHLNRQIQELMAANRVLESASLDAQAASAAKRTVESPTRRELAEQRRSIASLQAELSSAQEKAGRQDAIAQAQIRTLTADLASANAALVDAKSEITHLKAELKATKADMSRTIKMEQTKLRNTENHLTVVQEALAAAQTHQADGAKSSAAEIRSSAAAKVRAEAEARTLRAEVNALKEQLAERDLELSEARLSVKRLEAEQSQSPDADADNADDHEAVVNALQSQLSQALAKAQRAETDSAKNQQSADAAIDGLRRRIKDLEEEIEGLSSCPDNLRKEKAAREAAEVNAARLTGQVSSLEEEISALRDRVASLEAELEAARRPIVEAEAEPDVVDEGDQAPPPSAGGASASQSLLSIFHTLRASDGTGNEGIELPSGRVVPPSLIYGGEMLAVNHKPVMRLILRNQSRFSELFVRFAKSDAHMDREEFKTFCRDLQITPDIATEEQADEIFDMTNYSEASDGDTESLDREEYMECLVRIAAYYAPGDFDLTNSADVAAAFECLLKHINSHVGDGGPVFALSKH